MTIGIAASGPRAGSAIRSAVLGAELLGRGAIGGFAVFAILDDEGCFTHCETQRGGIDALHLPPSFLQAQKAAIISSGPDRPEPLVQFLPGKSGVGLVTGHRLPNRTGNDGQPLNKSVLQKIESGEDPQVAVEQVLAANAQADVGLIALTADGRTGWGNSARVQSRCDRGAAQKYSSDCSFVLLHNAIYSSDLGKPMAQILAEVAWAEMDQGPVLWRFVSLESEVPVKAGVKDRIYINDQDVITCIETADPHVPYLERRGTVVYLNAEVWQQSGLVGHAVTELYAEIGAGKAKPMEGLSARTLLMRCQHVQA